jgi:hypothetical protein
MGWMETGEVIGVPQFNIVTDINLEQQAIRIHQPVGYTHPQSVVDKNIG